MDWVGSGGMVDVCVCVCMPFWRQVGDRRMQLICRTMLLKVRIYSVNNLEGVTVDGVPRSRINSNKSYGYYSGE